MRVEEVNGQAINHVDPELVVNHFRDGVRVLRVVKQVGNFGRHTCKFIANHARPLAGRGSPSR